MMTEEETREKLANMPLPALLMLHVMYEYQHLAGRKGLTPEQARTYYNQTIEEFGSLEASIAGIRDRCGLS